MRILLIMVGFILSHVAFAQKNIAEARTMKEGELVTVQGIITSGPELGAVRYLQDKTAGIAAFPGSGSASGFGALKMGDKIEITGVLLDFNGLLEISPIQSFEILSTNNTIPEAELITLDQLGEANESELVSVSNVLFSDAGFTFKSDVSYDINADGAFSSVYLRSTNPLVGTTIPNSPVELTAISSAFFDPQMLPRSKDDINAQNTVFAFSEFPNQTDLETTTISVAWKTNFAGMHGINYGLTPAFGSTIEESATSQTSELTIEGLSANTFYYVQAFAEYQGNVIFAPIQLMSTASTSPGEVKVFFNHGVREEFADGFSPDGTNPRDMIEAILNLIDNADLTLDVCLYNIDQQEIIEAINAASARGVIVRYIANNGTSNSAITYTDGSYDVLYVNSFALMHNKFFIADASDIDNAWILTGSTNITEGNIYQDFNNMILIQDNTLAKAYTLEFTEIWGSTSEIADLNNATSGDEKVNNTPHLFKVDDILIESYFSPSDKTTAAIIKTLKTANNKVQFALLSFTKDDIAQTLIDLNQQGVAVSGILENINDQGSEFQNLNDNGVLVRKHDLPHQIHHKYALIDAFSSESDPTTITGSHNWSNGAETKNDENTLIIHDRGITNIYLQEYGQRSLELGPKLSTSNLSAIRIDITPNPTSTFWTITLPEGHDLTKCILQNTNGQLIKEFSLESGVLSFVINPLDLQSGLYFLHMIDASNNFVVKKLVKVH